MNKEKDVEKTGLEIAVIGMAGRFPGAKNIEEFWNNLKNGVHSISFLTEEEMKESGIDSQLPENSNYVRCKGGVLEEARYFDASFFGFTPDEAQVMNPQTRIFLECAWHALEDAGCNPDSYNGLIGLYAGASSSFQWEARTLLSGADDNIGKFAAITLKDKDYLCTRVSYILNLKGPSVTVNTACSTSLVAVDHACRALLTSVCDIALTGGVSLSLKKKTGYWYEEGMIHSPDGYCRAFDAEAAGVVSGEGIGTVVLKRLDEALADRDHIYAVIKGFASNNDGFRKAGFTAPSVDAQAEVIRAARQMAEVEFESIGYIETHGTGTPLGDPVEIEALKLAFNTDRTQFCAIGSVKTNIGHIDAAAGIAGFIKTVLVLKNKEIPPILHFKAPNPKIDFERSPFYVNTKLKKWQKCQYPLRAGVSSFGIGGTNAHVILEEAPLPKKSSESRPWQLILLSTKTEFALNQSAENLGKFLKEHPEIPLPDVSYTLQVGRKAFQYRRMLVCNDSQQALVTLLSSDSKDMKTFFAKTENSPVIFMFSGQGSQYIRMGWDLYRTEPYFRKIMDRCFKILIPLIGYNISEVLYPSWVSSGAPVAKNIDQTDVTQPLLFVFEYALSRLLMKWGLKPFAMIGHSIGEYTAACLAGVFSLEDALRLVVSRGKLMQKMPPGAMLSIHLSEDELTSLLKGKEDISLAAANSSSSCVISGPTDLIDTIKMEFEKKGYECRRLHTSHAFHSRMMLPIINEFKERVKEVKLKKPGIPYISNVTGNWITGEEVAEPRYWANHLRQTVRFATGINELLKNEDAIFVEVGPGTALSTFVRQHKNKKQTQIIVNLVRHPNEEVTDDQYLLKKLGELWLYGKPIEWSEFYIQEKRNRIPFPGYPFERKSFWIEDEMMKIGTGMLAASQPGKKQDMSDWFYYPSWERSLLTPPRNNEPMVPGCWLIFMDDYGLITELIEQMQIRPLHLILVRAGNTYAISKQNKTIFTINPKESKDYDALFTQLHETNKIPQKIVHLWNVTGNQKETGLDELDRSQDLGLYSLLNIVQAMGRLEITNDIQLEIVTDNMQEVTGEELICPEKATILGAVKTIPLEYPNMVCRSIDVFSPPSGRPQQDLLIHHLLSELTAEPPDPVNIVALRGNYRWEQVFKPIRLEKSTGESNRFRKGGVYFVTGGLGGIGFACAQHLARRYQAHLVLVGRSPFMAREKWNDWLASHDEGDRVSIKIREIRELEKKGASIQVFEADVTSLQQMQEVVAQVKKEFGLINGVIHSAGIVDYAGVIQRRTRDMTQSTIAAKVKGTLVLDYLCKDLDLDFLALFSSLGNQLYGGNFGQVGYNAANEFLEAFASFKNLKHEGFTVTINWTEWLEVGMAVEANRRQQRSKKNTPIPRASRDCISPSEGIELFSRIMEHSMHRVLVTTHDLSRMMEMFNRPFAGHSNTVAAEGEKTSSNRLNQKPGLSMGHAAPQNQIQQYLSQIFQEFFGIEKVGIHDDFFELGGDSLKVVTISSRIHKALDVKIPIQVFFNRPTIAALSEYIYNTEKSKFSAILPMEEKEYYELSSAQKRLYILQQIDLTATSYNVTMMLLLEGVLDREKLENTFRKSIDRHENFKTSFEMINERPVQRIQQHVDFKINYSRLTINDKEEEIIENFVKPFDLSQAPLMRVELIKLPPGKEKQSTVHMLKVDIHHIITDGTSMNLLMKEFTAYYVGEELSPLRLQYRDYAEWQNSKEQRVVIKQQETYWLKQFTGEIPVLNLPLDYPRPVIQSFAGSYIAFELSGEETHALNEISREEEVSLFMLLLAIFNIFLSKISGQEDIVVGTPVAGRRHADLERIIGMFVNTLPLRNQPAGEKKFKLFLDESKEKTLDVFENQDYQLENIIEEVAVGRDMSRNLLFDTMFSLRNFFEAGESDEIKEQEIEDLKIKPYPDELKTSKFDFSLDVFDVNGRLKCSFSFCKKLFREVTILSFINYFKKIISLLTQNPSMKISEIEIISEEEKKLILYEYNNTTSDIEISKTIIYMIEEQVEKIPENVAIIFKDETMTYKELNGRVNELAFILLKRGAKKGKYIPLLMNRSLEFPIALLAVLKAGAAFVPMDINWPIERISGIIKDLNSDIVLINDDINGVNFNIPKKCDIMIVEHFLSGLRLENPGITIKLDDPIYAIYTSGSTGKPKATINIHKGIANKTLCMNSIDKSTYDDVYLMAANLAVDSSFAALSWSLCSDCRLVIPSYSIGIDLENIITLVQEKKVTILGFVPSVFNIFVDQLICNLEVREKIKTLRLILIGGEEIKTRSLNAFKSYFPHIRIYNTYGPTETSIATIYYEINQVADTTIPIGKPINNVYVLILDKYFNIMPLRIAGELYLGGSCVGLGYLNDPEKTNDAFINSPNKSFAGGIFYKTGDLVRWFPDGNIEFLGRIDQQVKIRGFRIELGEIEKQLLMHPDIKESIVAVLKDETGDKYLCAYIVLNRKKLAVSEVRKYLSRQLPGYMVPSYFVFIDKIPLTPNCKVDHKALPSPEAKAIEGRTSNVPGNRVQVKLAEIWSDVLGIGKETIGIDDNFFLLGGQSLKATILVSKIHQALDVQLPLVEFFMAPTIKQLAKYINKTKKNEYAPIEPVEKKEYHTLSPAQKRLYILQQMQPGSLVYNMPEVVELEGEHDINKLEAAFVKMIKRHEILRTSFEIVNEKPVQKIYSQVNFKIGFCCLKNGIAVGKNIQDFVKPFDLSKAPLFRVGLINVEDQKQILKVDMHHIISDGTSMRIFVREILALYELKKLPTLRIQYKDFAEWQNNEHQRKVWKQQEKYWLNEFKGEIPVLDIPTDFPRPPVQSFEGSEINFELSAEEKIALDQITQVQGATFFMVLLSLYYILLYKLCGQEDIIVGTPVAGRRHADLQRIIGMMVNTLALRNFPVREKTFREFLKEVKNKALQSLENQEYPFEDLVDKVVSERDISRNPLVDVMLVFEDAYLEIQNETVLEEKRISTAAQGYEFKSIPARFDLVLTAAEYEDKLRFSFLYCTKLFKKETIGRFINYYRRIVQGVVKKNHVKISDIEIISPEEKNQVLYDFNNNRSEFPGNKTIHRLFEAQAEQTPDSIGVSGIVMGAQGAQWMSMSYRELKQESHQLAYLLRIKGVQPGDIVALVAERSIDMIVGLLGILKAGGAYLPIDLDSPQARINYMLADSSAKIVVTTENAADKVKSADCQLVLINCQPEGQVENLPDGNLLAIETCNLYRDIAYVIYTSGTTGLPKGVAVRHEGFVNLVYYRKKLFGENSDTQMSQVANPCFDAMGAEVWPCLLNGASLVIADNYTRIDAGRMKSWLIKNQITFSFQPTVMGEQLLKEDWSSCGISLQILIVAGDVLKSYPTDSIPFQLYNLYGPTEDTVWTTWARVTSAPEGNRYPHIGRPVANHFVYIMESGIELTPPGVPGELCISGEGLAVGYLNRPELTYEKFIENPFVKSQRLYRTGDLARWLSDGNIEFLGRIDHQVKIRGFRIELEEIENQLLKNKKIKQTLVTTYDSTDFSDIKEYNEMDKSLAAYIVSSEKLSAAELRADLINVLPTYMIPAHFIQIEKIPLTPNGKVNKRALSSLGMRLGTGVKYVAPQNKIEELIAAAWKKVLNVEQVGIHDNFFDVGGNSLTIVQVNNILKESLGIDIEAAAMFQYPTIHSLSRYLNQNDTTGKQLMNEYKNNMFVEVEDTMRETVQLFEHS